MKSLLLKLFKLSLVLAPLTKLCSQTTFVKHSMAAPIGPIDLYVQDINGDQYQDVVTISYPAGELSWWESIGAQSFTKHMIKTGYAGVHLSCRGCGLYCCPYR